ncbi:MAG: late competence development ComFB family protein [Clostridiales bacterium]|nr:late competence development ComFB family protein [Clostridiales bacterium]
MAENQGNAAARKRPVHYQLVNAYDELVQNAVRDVMAKTEMCQCEKCFLDICAIVFNQGYTHFVNTREGQLLKKIPSMNLGNQVEMMVQVMHALKLVKNFPHHDADDAVDAAEAGGC